MPVSDSLSLKNHNVLITGVSRSLGIGAAIAKKCGIIIYSAAATNFFACDTQSSRRIRPA